MGISHNKLQVKIHLNNIVQNYQTLNQKGGCAYPVIKADAYGHGLLETAEALAKAGARTLAVGTVNEAVSLRESPYGGRILCLLGPVDEKDYEPIAEHDILALAYRSDQLELLCAQAKKRGKPVSVALKFDTGMARLGFGPEDVPDLVEKLNAYPELELCMVCSHLATA
ncbi:MAG: alanine racemase, partial [Thermodesulfobacteriota bacterium]|nr:alanine racemase [Thermodesulfobacteriota bacterium]